LKDMVHNEKCNSPKTFREFLDNKNCCETFRSAYIDQCNVCRKTMRIVECIDKDRRLKEKLIDELKINRDYLEEFLDADCCDFEITERICDYLNIEENNECGKKGCI